MMFTSDEREDEDWRRWRRSKKLIYYMYLWN